MGLVHHQTCKWTATMFFFRFQNGLEKGFFKWSQTKSFLNVLFPSRSSIWYSAAVLKVLHSFFSFIEGILMTMKGLVWAAFWAHQPQKKKNIRIAGVHTSSSELWLLLLKLVLKIGVKNDVKFVWLRQGLYSPLQKGMSYFYGKLSLQSPPCTTTRDLELPWMAVLQSRYFPSSFIFLTFGIT